MKQRDVVYHLSDAQIDEIILSTLNKTNGRGLTETELGYFVQCADEYIFQKITQDHIIAGDVTVAVVNGEYVFASTEQGREKMATNPQRSEMNE